MAASFHTQSVIDSVDFGFLPQEEIQAISVKRIENDSTFDSLLDPVPGGLYDPALGSWGDSPCSTCNLLHSCPGHPGHIQLPLPVYHPVFLDQTYRLLRSQCVYCKGFRLAEHIVHLYICKLKLLKYGLVREANIVDGVGEKLYGIGPEDVPSDDEAKEDGAADDSKLRAREAFVRKAIRKHLKAGGRVSHATTKHEGAGALRRQIIKEFLAEAPCSRKCRKCGGISPSYRRDRFVKIFEKALSPKEKLAMAAKNFKAVDALSRVRKNADNAKNGTRTANGHAAAEEMADVEGVGPLGEGTDEAVVEEAGDSAPVSGQRYISAMEVRGRLRELFEVEHELISLVYNAKPPQSHETRVSADMFFLSTLLVPPNRYRPEARMGGSQISEAQQNSLYKNILRSSFQVSKLHRTLGEGTDHTGVVMDRLHVASTQLQEAVNSLIDKDRNPNVGKSALKNEDGIKQILEKKEGLFRMNMMGKRVNHAARSVISPDPNLETNEIGVPPVFASKLTYPEPVTSHNFRDLQHAVINGPLKWPGASAIQNENGHVVSLRNKTMDERIALANQLMTPSDPNTKAKANRSKKVFRHITNGDIVLMNRQPSLHRPSIMGHRVRVLPGEKTLRMHYANCNTYNADFDGDEMNMHFPQNELARVEAMDIANTDNQYISTTQGAPLRGLIQDHISVSVALCNRDTFFDRPTYNQLVYSALRPESGHTLTDRIELVWPAILKPAKRWTGKQVITTILKNITPQGSGGLWMKAQTKIPAGEWGPNSEEGMVEFQDGQFLTGILDKSHIGPSSGGLVHAVHEVYGPKIAGQLLSSLGRLLTKYLNMRAFSCGMDDLRFTKEGERRRKEILGAASRIGLETAANYVSLGARLDDPELPIRLEEVMRDDSKQEGLDRLMNGACDRLKDSVNKELMPGGLVKKFPVNRMQTMTVSGAKGSKVNATLISCSLGQQVLEGRRVPVMASGKTLPCFDPFETHARAGGFVVNRFLTGIRPQEYYFHHMAGREGLIDTAVKTSRSGYLQRCLIKGLEGLTVNYDSTVRDSDGSMVQFLYGEDGIDVAKTKYLNDFGFILRNMEPHKAQLKFGPEVYNVLSERRDDIVRHMKSAIKHAKAGDSKLKDPANSLVNPAKFAFATSERFFDEMSNYIRANPDGLIREKSGPKSGPKNKATRPATTTQVTKKMAETLFAVKYVRCQTEPGEAVGIVAGQSVGEPSTQMTLNTFHLAGHSGKNVTLGIPRLREILMTARKTIATPSMTLYLNPGIGEALADQFAKSISILPLANILDKAIIRERIGRDKAGGQSRLYDVRLNFFPAPEYAATYGVGPREVMDCLEHELIHALIKQIKKEIKKQAAKKSAAPEIGAKAGVVEMASADAHPDGAPADDDEDGDGDEVGDEDGDEDGDGDDTDAKQKSRRKEAVSYGPNDEEDNEIQHQNESEDDAGEEDGLMDEGGLGASSAPGSPKPRSERRDGGDEDSGADRGEGGDEGGDGMDSAEDGGSREVRIKERHQSITHWGCDEKDGGWALFTLAFDMAKPKMLMLDLVQKAIKSSVIQQVAGLKTCTFTPSVEKMGKAEEAHITVDGVNLKAMHEHADIIDVTRIKTNDIYAVLTTYGVEAGRTAIVAELVVVFGSHGISVDPRHLNLIADYMTRNGEFTPFNRIGLKGNASPFTKMSFETTVGFLKDTVLDGDWDELLTPSSRLVVGTLGTIGTGSFDVLNEDGETDVVTDVRQAGLTG